jgi:copper resistance protein B
MFTASVHAQQPQDEHAGHVMPLAETSPVSPVPPLTDEDRAAAFPDVEGHAAHDDAINYFVLSDQFEWRQGDGGGDLSWDTKGWIGRDLNRLWFRTEGEASRDDMEHAEAHVLYGRAFARWWDLVAGIRQDFSPGPSRTSAAFGIQGLAPYWFEVEATGYIGEGGRTHARFEAEYDLLLTNRFIAQPLFEVEFYGRPDVERHIGKGLSSTELGVRFRYEVRRELAPYVGVTWNRVYGGTRDLAKSTGKDVSSTRVTVGLRAWF